MPAPSKLMYATFVADLELWHLRICVESRAQCDAQWLQPWLVMTPLVETIAKYGFAYLLSADRAYCALIVVEPEGRGLERQTAKCQQAAHLAFGIRNHPFVDDTVKGPRKYLLEVGHELDVVAVIAT